MSAYRLEVRLRLKLWQDDDLSTGRQTSQHDDHLTVDVIERQHARDALQPRFVVQDVTGPGNTERVTVIWMGNTLHSRGLRYLVNVTTSVNAATIGGRTVKKLLRSHLVTLLDSQRYGRQKTMYQNKRRKSRTRHRQP